MDSEEYFKDQYFYELNRRDRLFRDLNLPFAILVALTTAAISLVDRLSRPFSKTELILCGLLIGSVMVITGLIFTLWRSWAEHPYSYPATSDRVKEFSNQLVSYHRKQNDEDDAAADEKFKTFLLSEYIRCSAKNALQNDRRSAYLKWSKRLILVLAIVVGLGYTLAAVNQVLAPQQTHKEV